MTAAYSDTPLVKKLGYKEGMNVLLNNVPSDYFQLVEMPAGVKVLQKHQANSADLVHVFCTKQTELEELIEIYKPCIRKNGMIWISWPKGSSGIATEINENIIRDYILANGLVDVKVAAFDQTWSALKLMYRTRDR